MTLPKAPPDKYFDIIEYAVLWNPKIEREPQRWGRIYLRCKGWPPRPKRWASFRVEDPAEILTILDILRNEKPVKFNPSDHAIKTMWEEPGEEETPT